MKKEILLDEMKQIEVEILKEIDHICKEADVKYYLCGGTLLGAVRHKGFIPWDDDIDIIMKRNDYEKFKEYVKEKKLSRYKLLSYDTTDGYYYSFMKMIDTNTELIEHKVKSYPMGVYVDIFPLDGFPSNKWIQKIHFTKIMFYRKSLSMYQMPEFKTDMKYFKFLKKWWYNWSQKKGPKYLIKRLENVVMKYPFEKYKLGGCFVHGYGMKEITKTNCYDSSIDMEFEGKMFPCPIGYEEYLTNLYGDYMQLPPEEKRITHHHYDLYRK